MLRKKLSRLRLNAPTCCYIASTLLVFLVSIVPASLVSAADIQTSVASTEQSQLESKLHYKVRSGDSLLRISKRLKLPDTHYYQVAVALFIKNPQAFALESLHKLKTGATLTAPAVTEVAAISLQQAKKIIAQGKISRQQAVLLQTVHNNATTDSDNRVTSKKQPISLISSQPDTTTHAPAKQANAPEPALLAKVKSIRNSIKAIEDSLPSSTQQKEIRKQYLQKTQTLITQLEDLSADSEQHQADFDTKLLALSTRKQTLLQKKSFYQQTNQSLKAQNEWAAFLLPKNYSYIKGIKPDQYFLNTAIRNRQNKPLSPLLEKAEALHCAVEQNSAASVVETLFNISPEKHNWPDELLGQKQHTANIHAGTMDILLAALYRNIQRFPELAELSERVALQWNYCTIVGHDNTFYNLKLQHDQLSTTKAVNDAPLNWSGFRRWGFSSPISREHYSPTLLEAHEPYHAYEIFFHQTHRKQCFPHPVTGERRFDTTTELSISDRAFIPPQPEGPVQPYPYTWLPLCEIPTVNVPRPKAWTTSLLTTVKYKLDLQNRKIEELSTNIDTLKADHTDKQRHLSLSQQRLEEQITQLETEEQERQEDLDFQFAEIQTIRSLAGQAEAQARQKIALTLQQATLETHPQQQTPTDSKEEALEKQIAETHNQQKAEITKKQTAEGIQRANDYKTIQKLLVMREAAEQRIQLLREQLHIAKLEAGEERLRLLHKELQVAELTAFEEQRISRKQRLATLQKQLLLAEKAVKERLAILRKQLRLAEDEAKQAALAAVEAEKIARKRATALSSLRKRLHNAPKVNFAKAAKPTLHLLQQKLRSAPNVDFGTAAIAKTQATDKKDKKLGITATAILAYPLSDEPSASLSLSWKPLENWFARASLKYTKDDELTYSWGVGYSDWRPGTTSVQLNNWGPIKSGEGLDFDDAILSISHKIDSEYLRDKKISTSLGITQPLSGDLAVNATFQWAPVENWYFRTTASQDLHGGPTNWSYSFGYFDWRPNTWRVEYSNYEKNRYPFDDFKKGAITINRAWEF